MHEKRHLLSYWKHRHNAKIVCTYAHYITGESLQNGQLELQKWSWYLARETHTDTALSVWACQAGLWKSTRTLCQQQNCQNWQYGLVSTGQPFVLQWVDWIWNVLFDRCFFFFLFSLCRLIEHDWSMTELQWSWISHFSVYYDRNYYYIYYFQRCE